jgi:hypothetical protein
VDDQTLRATAPRECQGCGQLFIPEANHITTGSQLCTGRLYRRRQLLQTKRMKMERRAEEKLLLGLLDQKLGF